MVFCNSNHFKQKRPQFELLKVNQLDSTLRDLGGVPVVVGCDYTDGAPTDISASADSSGNHPVTSRTRLRKQSLRD